LRVRGNRVADGRRLAIIYGLLRNLMLIDIVANFAGVEKRGR
jgi:hypothetical protein